VVFQSFHSFNKGQLKGNDENENEIDISSSSRIACFYCEIITMNSPTDSVVGSCVTILQQTRVVNERLRNDCLQWMCFRPSRLFGANCSTKSNSLQPTIYNSSSSRWVARCLIRSSSSSKS
jgi:hypothetical protein